MSSCFMDMVPSCCQTEVEIHNFKKSKDKKNIHVFYSLGLARRIKNKTRSLSMEVCALGWRGSLKAGRVEPS